MNTFENWLDSNKSQLDNVVVSLFTDSLRCFKADIDRPAYLLAYQGMMLHLKNVILSAKKPDGYLDGEWKDYLKGLRHDHSWDENTYDRIVQREKNNLQDPSKNRPPIMCMTDEVRNKFPFFRDMRNICAHYKEYYFIKAHTVVLYSFIQQYLLSISVEGGMQSILQEFKKFYDPSFTPDDAPVEPLVDKIPSKLQVSEISDFLNKLSSLLGWDYRSKMCLVLYLMIHRLPKQYGEATYLYIRNNEGVKYEYIDNDPESVHHLLTNENEIRHFWYDQLYLQKKPLEILVQLLQAGKLKDKEEVFNRLLSFYYKNKKPFSSRDNNTWKMLFLHNFQGCFYKFYFCSNYTRTNYQDICYNTDFYMSIIERIPIDDDFVKQTLDVFEDGYAIPYTLRDRFKREFLSNENVSNSFNEILTRLNLQLPNSLSD